VSRAAATRLLGLGLGIGWAGAALLFGGSRAARLTVVSGAGNPVPGAVVRVFPSVDEIDLSAPPLAAAHTDDHGRAELSWQYAPPVMVLVSATGFQSAVLAEPAPDARVALERGRDVSYEVKSSALSGRCRLSWNAGPGVRAVVVSDDRGRGTLPGMTLRAASVTIVSGGARAERKVAAGVTTVVFDLRPQGAIEGRLVDPDGAPQPDGLVSIERELTRDTSYTTRETRTSEIGRFRFAGLAAGHYTLECVAAGLVADPVSVRLEEGQQLRLPPTRLRAGSTVLARFEDAATAEPVPTPRVVRESIDPKGFSLRELHRPSTPYVGDSEGRLRIDGLGPGPLSLALDSPPFARTRLPLVEVDADPRVIDVGTIRVGVGATLELTVVDRAGAPVASLPVALDRGPALSPLHPAEASTDGEGKVRFARLGKGRYRVRIGGDNRAGGRATLREEWFPVEDDTQVIARRLVVGSARLTVVVMRDTGPVAGRWVTLENEVSPIGPVLDIPVHIAGAGGEAARLIAAPPRGSAAARTDSSGRVTLTDVQPGPKRLLVELGQGAWSCPLEAPDDDGRVSVLIPPASAVVRVVDESDRSPVPSARATWTGAQGVRADGFSREGSALLDGIPDGPGRLEITAPGYEGHTLDLADGREIPPEVGLRGSGDTSLTCRVVDETGIPIADAVVDLVRTYPRLARKIALTDQAGEATITGLEPGPIRLVVRRRGYASSVPRDIGVEPGLNDLGVLALSRGFRIIVDTPVEEGAAPERVSLRLLDQRGTDLGKELDDESLLAFFRGGQASLGPVAPGEYRLEMVDETSSRTERVTVVDADVTVEFK
jgi:hypothetical protein